MTYYLKVHLISLLAMLFAWREARIAQVLRKTVPEVLSMARGRRPTHSLDYNIQLVLLITYYDLLLFEKRLAK